MKTLKGGLAAGVRAKASQGFAANLNKVLEEGGLGKYYRLYLPTIKTEDGLYSIQTANVPGRNCDFSRMGTGFFPLDDFELTETGKIVDKTNLGKLARLSGALFDAELANALRKKENEMKDEAEQSGDDLDTGALKRAQDEIKIKFLGSKRAGFPETSPAVLPKEAQAISGVQIKIATEGYLLPIDKETKAPDWSKGCAVSISLDVKKKADKISDLLANKGAFDPEDGYLEVQIEFSGTSVDLAKRNYDFASVDRSARQAVLFPEQWEKNYSMLKTLLEKDDAAIANRNRMFSTNLTVQEIMARFQKYASSKSILVSVDFDNDNTKKMAKLFKEYDIGTSIPKVNEKILAAIAEIEATKAVQEDNEDDPDEVDARIKDAAAAKTLQETMAAVGVEGYDSLVAKDDGYSEL